MPLPTSRVRGQKLSQGGAKVNIRRINLRDRTDHMELIHTSYTVLSLSPASFIGWDFTIQEPNKKIIKKKVYADNFKYSPEKLRFVKTK